MGVRVRGKFFLDQSIGKAIFFRSIDRYWRYRFKRYGR